MKRKIYDKLLDWKQKDHKKVFLLIDGARRVGKSWIVEEFARREYESYVIIDFNEANSTVKEFFTEYLHDLDAFFMRIAAFRKWLAGNRAKGLLPEPLAIIG